MNTNALLFAIATALLALPLIALLYRWLTERLAERLVAQLVARSNLSGGRPELSPECDVVVEASDTGATCSRPDGTIESIQWNDLQKVAILTTDDGPFAPDMFWVLQASQGGCLIPWGATGEKQLIDRLQALPGFRNEVIIRAASLTTNNLLICWERAPQDPITREK